MKVKKIIATTDLSTLSGVAVRHALELASREGAEVIVYHVISEDSDWLDKNDALNPARALVPKQKQRLDEFVKENFAAFLGKVKIRLSVEVGIPYKAIVRKADEEKADMIVMSTHGRTGMAHLMLGSVTQKVVAHATCPVLSLRPTQTPTTATNQA